MSYWKLNILINDCIKWKGQEKLKSCPLLLVYRSSPGNGGVTIGSSLFAATGDVVITSTLANFECLNQVWCGFSFSVSIPP